MDRITSHCTRHSRKVTMPSNIEQQFRTLVQSDTGKAVATSALSGYRLWKSCFAVSPQFPHSVYTLQFWSLPTLLHCLTVNNLRELGNPPFRVPQFLVYNREQDSLGTGCEDTPCCCDLNMQSQSQVYPSPLLALNLRLVQRSLQTPKIRCFQINKLSCNQQKLTFPQTAFHNYNITQEVCKCREWLHDQMVSLTFLPMQLSN